VRRLFWVALGATVGVLVVRRIGRAAQAYTPEGISRSLTAAVDALRELADDVRAGMAEREQELRVALGVEPGTMDAEGGAASIEGPPYRGRDPQGR
jgi:HAMP domain-containing protein